MNSKSELISYRLKDRIKLLESLVQSSSRVQLSKSAGSSYSVGWDYKYTKPVKSSCIYLYQLGRYFESNPSFGISFKFLEEYSSRNKLPLHEQTVQFSICYDPNAEDKVIQYSKAFDLVQAKKVLRKLTDRLKEKKLEIKQEKKPSCLIDSSDFIEILNDVVFNFTPEDLVKVDEEILSKFSGEIAHFQQKVSENTQLKSDYANAKDNFQKEIEEDEDFILQKELQEKLEKVNERVLVKRKSLNQKHNVAGLRAKLNQSKQDVSNEKEKVLSDIRSYLVKNSIPLEVANTIKETLEQKGA